MLFQVSSLLPDLKYRRTDVSCQPDGCSSKQDVAGAQPQTLNTQNQLMAVLKLMTHSLATLTDEYQEL
jgi:hypothetical protein